MKFALLAVWVVPGSVLSQAAPNDPWSFLAAYGAAAPFAALCLWMLNRKDKEIETLRAEVSTITAAGMGQVVPALVRATEQQKEAGEVLQAATSQIHMMLARSPDAIVLDRIFRVLRAVELRLDANDR